jgi:mRNA interferase MazF
MLEGDIILVEFSPTVGHEQSGKRPALVVSAEEFNTSTGLVWVVPITSHRKSLPGELSLPEGLTTQGVLLLAQPRALDFRARRAHKLESVPTDFLEDVRARLRAVIS